MRMLNSLPKILLHLEGLAFFLLATFSYIKLGGSLWPYLLLILLPDIGMLGYLVSKRVGSYTYNALHFYMIPIALGIFGFLQDSDILVFVSLIWIAHIGIDRAIGYGLKYNDDFKSTHLGKV
jgi:hypothetical protein